MNYYIVLGQAKKNNDGYELATQKVFYSLDGAIEYAESMSVASKPIITKVVWPRDEKNKTD